MASKIMGIINKARALTGTAHSSADDIAELNKRRDEAESKIEELKSRQRVGAHEVQLAGESRERLDAIGAELAIETKRLDEINAAARYAEELARAKAAEMERESFEALKAKAVQAAASLAPAGAQVDAAVDALSVALEKLATCHSSLQAAVRPISAAAGSVVGESAGDVSQAFQVYFAARLHKFGFKVKGLLGELPDWRARLISPERVAELAESARSRKSRNAMEAK